MELNFRENYWDSPELKRDFISFLTRIFGVDLSPWDKMGFWDNNYRPFSYFGGNSLVSNVCVYTMEMTILGKQCRAAQISAVATLPEHRRKGLAYKLMKVALKWAQPDHEIFFLFADDVAFELYRKCGFRPIDEFKTKISIQGSATRQKAVKLDMQKKADRQLAFSLASKREPVSDMLGIRNEKLFMFWCLGSLKGHIHYIPALDILVLYKREGGLITIFDIVGARMPSFDEIFPFICEPGDTSAEFLFMPDKLKLDKFDQVMVQGNGTRIMSSFPLADKKFIFPFTSHA